MSLLLLYKGVVSSNHQVTLPLAALNLNTTTIQWTRSGGGYGPATHHRIKPLKVAPEHQFVHLPAKHFYLDPIQPRFSVTAHKRVTLGAASLKIRGIAPTFNLIYDEERHRDTVEEEFIAMILASLGGNDEK